MTTRKQMKQRLLEDREKLMRQREALDNQILGLERAIALTDNEPLPEKTGYKRQPIKATVLDLLEEVGTTGLNAITALELAGNRGQRLERGSVSSLLSRLKGDGIVVYDGDVYRLTRYATQTSDVGEDAVSVLDERTLRSVQ